MAVAGIHFGNSNCAVAVLKDGRLTVVSNETGERTTPTVVGYTGAEKIIGLPAKQLAVRSPLSVITSIKSLIGTSHLEESNFKHLQKKCSCQIIIQQDCPCFNVSFDESEVIVTPTKAALFVLTKLLENAESIGGDELEDTVLTVPTWFTEKQRIELSEACEDTGFNVLRVISEPSAALLAYGIGQDVPLVNSLVLVYRIGGTSMDATLVEVNSGMYRIVSSCVDHEFGGDTFDDVLCSIFIEEFRRKCRMNIKDNKRGLRKLKTAAEQCKCILSTINATTCSVDSLHEGVDFTCPVTRAKFESCCSNEFNKCQRFLADLLKQSGVDKKDIDKVILVGGSTRIPKIRQMITELFLDSKILTSLKPEEIIATGAACQAAILQGKEEIDFADLTCPLDCTSSTISLQISETEDAMVISKNTPVPFRRIHSYKVPEEKEELCMQVFESNESDQKQNSQLLAKFVLSDVKKDSTIDMVFEMSRDCAMRVIVTDKEQSKTQSVNIELATS